MSDVSDDMFFLPALLMTTTIQTYYKSHRAPRWYEYLRLSWGKREAKLVFQINSFPWGTRKNIHFEIWRRLTRGTKFLMKTQCSGITHVEEVPSLFFTDENMTSHYNPPHSIQSHPDKDPRHQMWTFWQNMILTLIPGHNENQPQSMTTFCAYLIFVTGTAGAACVKNTENLYIIDALA